MRAQLLSLVQLCVTPWTVAHQAPLSMRFFRQKYWSGLPFPCQGHLPDPGVESTSPAWQTDSLHCGTWEGWRQGVTASELAIHYIKRRPGAPCTDTAPQTLSLTCYLCLLQHVTFPCRPEGVQLCLMLCLKARIGNASVMFTLLEIISH